MDSSRKHLEDQRIGTVALEMKKKSQYEIFLKNVVIYVRNSKLLLLKWNLRDWTSFQISH